MRFPRALLVLGFLAALASSGPEKPGIPAAKTEITADSREQIVADVVKTAKEKWIAQGLSEDLADKLAPDVAVVLRSYMTDDFDTVNRLWTSRGAALGSWAAASAEQELTRGDYPEADVDRLKSASTEDRIRYLWTHAAQRSAQWERIGTDHVLAGTKAMVTMGSRDWPPNGANGLGSRWDPPHDQHAKEEWEKTNTPPAAQSGWTHLQTAPAAAPQTRSGWVSLSAKSIQGDIPTAFVQFPLKVRQGTTILWRMSFGYDAERAAWYPLNLSYSDGSSARPIW